MPRPVFIICSLSRSVDQATNQLSVFNVIEGFEIERHGPGGIRLKGEDVQRLSGPMVSCVSMWMREDDDDPEDDYELEIVVHRPDGSVKREQLGTFRFTKPYNRTLGNLVLGDEGMAHGVLRIEICIRKVGDTDWISQDYPIPITLVEPAEKKSAEAPAEAR